GDAHFFVQPPLFRQVADAILETGIDAAAKQENAAGIGRGNVDDHADGGRLTGPVRPKKPENTARAHIDTELPDRCELPKTLAHPIQFYGRVIGSHLALSSLKRRRRSLI